MNDDAALLRRYSEEGSEEAFAELVRRHVDLVYGAAMRRTGGDAHRAADVAQQVFVALAQNAHRLTRHSVLAAWLHTATRNAALKLMISEQRRQVREAGALELDATGGANRGEPAWEALRPLLDAAVDALPETDRAAVVLRFLERRAFAEIGQALRISEDAARMRVERALEKMRAILARQGIRSSAAALGTVVAAQPLVAAPAGLAASVVAHALAGVAPAAVTTAAVSFMSAKLVTTVAVSAILAFLIGSYAGRGWSASDAAAGPNVAEFERAIGSLRAENQRLQVQADALRTDLLTQRENNAALEASEAAARQTLAERDAASRRSPNIGMVRHEVQQAILNNLRQIAAARDQFQLENGRPPDSIHALVGDRAFIRRVRTVGGEAYDGLPMNGGPLTVTTPDGIAVTYDPAGVLTTKPDVPPEVLRVQQLREKVAPLIEKAVAAYRTANEGRNPADEKALLPYFATPQEGADFVEFVEAQKSAAGK